MSEPLSGSDFAVITDPSRPWWLLMVSAVGRTDIGPVGTRRISATIQWESSCKMVPGSMRTAYSTIPGFLERVRRRLIAWSSKTNRDFRPERNRIRTKARRIWTIGWVTAILCHDKGVVRVAGAREC